MIDTRVCNDDLKKKQHYKIVCEVYYSLHTGLQHNFGNHNKTVETTIMLLAMMVKGVKLVIIDVMMMIIIEVLMMVFIGVEQRSFTTSE
jgi:hypothetical protein